MPDDRNKFFSKKGTGTVPKTKLRNNTSCSNYNYFERNLPKNLGFDWQQHNEVYPNICRNRPRNFYPPNPYSMETFTEDPIQNGIPQINMPGAVNGTLSTSSTSESNSRRDSEGTIPKCDNVKKCPDKKQIEDKLNQIREYLQVTTSLMSSIKNEDQSAESEREQFKKMIQDLKDSEAKLLALLSDPFYDDENVEVPPLQNDNEQLENGTENMSEPSVSGYQRNALEEKVELTNRKVQLLREQQNALVNLKRKAENQLRNARQAQENLLLMQQQQQQQEKSGNQLRNAKVEAEQAYGESNCNDKNFTETQFDAAIKELEDRLDSMRNNPRRSVERNQNGAQPESNFVHDPLDNRNQLLHLLDNRDNQLNSENLDLQEKFNELRSKNMQMDQLAQQLQNLSEEEDEDIGSQVRKIVTMKQQLSSLKDLLEIVKNTECSLLDSQNVNELELEPQTNGFTNNKTDNIRQGVHINHNQIENNSIRSNDQFEKQSNKSVSNVQQRERVLAELKAKKRELEEIVYKQKDRTSINNDVCSETSVNKSDLGSNNMFENAVMSWLPVHLHQHNQVASAYSSDDCPEEDINEFSDLNSSADVTIGTIPRTQPALSSNYSTPSFNKRRATLNQRMNERHSDDFIRQVSPSIGERHVPTASTTLPPYNHERASSNNSIETDNSKVQFQKKLELIQCVCQSLLDQQGTNNVQQLRNNLTPSPMYTEPRSFISSNPRQNSISNDINTMVGDMSYHMNNGYTVNPQCFALGEVANSQNMLAANTLQTQAFLLNTLNQCCQMLWFQQREIASLRNMICTMQEQMANSQSEQDLRPAPIPTTSYVYPTRPVSSLSNFRASSQPRNFVNPRVNHVSAACSLPNLNPISPHANSDGVCSNQNNVRPSASARLLETSLNNTAPIHNHHNLNGEQPANNRVLPNVNINSNISQSLPSQIWNGQALNNQVAPGNRANNYWDNFRSYSRQNLLSTSSKSNEGLQNSGLERSNSTYDRSQVVILQPVSVPKLNMVHNEATSTSQESTPQRQLHFKTSQNSSVSNKPMAAIPPDVLNINHYSTQKVNQQQPDQSNETLVEENLAENNSQMGINHVKRVTPVFKDYVVRNRRNRNKRQDNEQADNSPKSKLFEELRDNVYKEVASLISANESRPHFLIQLFRDLQHINSDPLRGRTLQSIQSVITNSLNILENRGANRQSASQPNQADQEVVQVDTEYFSLQPSLWPQSPVSTSRESCNMELESTEDPDIHKVLKKIFSFLKSHHNDVLNQELTDLLKDCIIKAIPFTQISANTNLSERTFHKHLISILNGSFEKYQGRRIAEIRKDLLKTLSDVLVDEFSFIYLVQENILENCENPTSATNVLNADNSLSLNLQAPPPLNKVPDEGNTPQMQNGDLAEADQSRIEVQEEEGAVGGLLNVIVEVNSTTPDLLEADVADPLKINFPINTEAEVEYSEQGLDEVPTRLMTAPQSQSNTSIGERSNSLRLDPNEHF